MYCKLTKQSTIGTEHRIVGTKYRIVMIVNKFGKICLPIRFLETGRFHSQVG
jgi:hypothetical protein